MAPRVLGVHRLEVDDFRVLGLVGVLSAVEQAQVRQLLARQGAFLGHHALDGFLEDPLREATVEDVARFAFLDPAGIAGVMVVGLLRQLIAGELHLVGVDDDDIVAVVDVRGVVRAMLAAQTVGDEGRKTANDDAFGVDQDPLVFHIGRLQRNRGFGVHGNGCPVIKSGRAIRGATAQCQSTRRALEPEKSRLSRCGIIIPL